MASPGSEGCLPAPTPSRTPGCSRLWEPRPGCHVGTRTRGGGSRSSLSGESRLGDRMWDRSIFWGTESWILLVFAAVFGRGGGRWGPAGWKGAEGPPPPGRGWAGPGAGGGGVGGERAGRRAVAGVAAGAPQPPPLLLALPIASGVQRGRSWLLAPNQTWLRCASLKGAPTPDRSRRPPPCGLLSCVRGRHEKGGSATDRRGQRRPGALSRVPDPRSRYCFSGARRRDLYS